MKCPACKKEMTEKDFGGVHVDVCNKGCMGLWFDWMELIKLDEKDEGFGKALEQSLAAPKKSDKDRGQIPCPKCGTNMHTHLFKTAKHVSVDECYKCAGFFLDAGELAEIRNKSMNEKELKEYRDNLVAGVSAFAGYKKDAAKEKERQEAIVQLTKFLRPSELLRKKSK